MSSFTTPLIAELIGKNKWRVKETFQYHIGSYPSEKVITVPNGFETDFASVPRIFWPLISPVDDHGKAAVVHDYCYYIGCYSKSECDKIFKEALETLRVPTYKVFFMYWAVKIFGVFRWRSARKFQEEFGNE